MLKDILEEHLDEADFLWSQWERALMAPDFDLSETAVVEARLLAHIDGLVEAGEFAAEALLRPELASEEPARLSAVAFSLLHGREEDVEEVMARLRTGNRGQRMALGRALQLSTGQHLIDSLLALVKADEPELLAVVLEVLSFSEHLPAGLPVSVLLHEAPWVRAVALRGLRRLAERVRREILEAGLDSSHPEICNAAIEAGLYAGLRSAWNRCHQLVQGCTPGCKEAMVLLALGGDEQDAWLLVELLQEPTLRAHVLWALGFTGRPFAAERCLEWVADERLAPLAGEAFSSITGLKLEGPYAMPPSDEPPEQPIPFEEDDLDADLMPRPEEDLPWPDADAVADWWRREQGRFQRQGRYLHGSPYDAQALLGALEHAPMRRRQPLALELSLRSRGALFVQPRAFTQTQRVSIIQALPRLADISMQPLGRMLR